MLFDILVLENCDFIIGFSDLDNTNKNAFYQSHRVPSPVDLVISVKPIKSIFRGHSDHFACELLAKTSISSVSNM